MTMEDPNVIITCKLCNKPKTPTEYARQARIARHCRDCVRLRTSKYRGKHDIAAKLLFNLKANFRRIKSPVGCLWLKRDVQKLLDQWETPRAISDLVKYRGYTPKLRIVCVDKTRPFTPDNARLWLFGT